MVILLSAPSSQGELVLLPPHLESRLQTSAEEMRWITSTSARADGPGACTGVLCDLQKRGSYFHHGTTPPHWPCNGALPLLDWLARLKAALSHHLRRCWQVWGSSLVPCTSAHECVYVFAYITASILSLMGVTRNLMHINPHICQMCPGGKLQQVYHKLS